MEEFRKFGIGVALKVICAEKKIYLFIYSFIMHIIIIIMI